MLLQPVFRKRRRSYFCGLCSLHIVTSVTLLGLNELKDYFVTAEVGDLGQILK